VFIGRYALQAKTFICALPHEWLLEHIEAAAEPTLRQNDFLDWANILDVFSRVDSNLGTRLALRAAQHSDYDIRAWGEDYLQDSQNHDVAGRHNKLNKESVMANANLMTAIERNDDKVSGAWVFRGTRVPVAALFENLKDGASIDEFLEWFPGVTRNQIETLLDYELTTLTELTPA
jgi:uncharacterized protein (DUF433 family)